MAQLPDGEEDEEGRVQAPSYAMFMIGARCHKPFGIIDRRFKRIGEQFNAVSLVTQTAFFPLQRRSFILLNRYRL
jgi:hypothetical protein